MKRLLIVLLSSLFILSGCSSQSSTIQSPAVSTPEPIPEQTTPAPEPELTSYDDGILSCLYDDSILQLLNNGENIYFILQLGISSEDVENADYIYVSCAEFDFDVSNFLNENESEVVKTIFDSLFFGQTNDSNASITSYSNNLYEYSLSQSNYTYKGKILYVENNTIAVAAYRVNDEVSSEIKDAFDTCYESIEYTSPAKSPSSAEERLSQLNEEAAETAASSERITDGPLYEAITAIYDDVIIFDMEDTVSITINLPHKEYDSDAATFYYYLLSICASCELEKNYSTVVFSLMVDSKSVTTLSLLDYEALGSFSTVEPFVFVDEYKEPIKNYYSTIFSPYDVSTNYEKDLDTLKEKYGLS